MIEKSEIYKWWDVFKNGGDLTEIRILSGNKTWSGYFKDVNTLINCIEPFSNSPHTQIYFTLNHIKEACYGRSQCNKIIQIFREPTTSDVDIDGRTHILIDLDPKRPAGVSSSEEELNYAYLKACDVYNWLMSQGFYEPIVCRSGNGYHVIVPCLIAATPENTETIKKFLQVLSMIFSDEHIDVDEKVFNLARISKLPGTMACKGENTLDRPWRQSMIVHVPSEVKATDIAYFKKVAAMFPEEEKPNRYNNYSSEKFDLVEFLNKHGIGYTTQRVAGGTKYILEHCPFNDQHKHKDAVIFQRDSGAIGFLCFHNSCSGKTWRDVRLLFEPDAYDKDYMPQPQMYKQQMPLQQVAVSTPLVQQQEKGKIWLKMSEIKRPRIDLKDYIPSGIPYIDEKGLGFRRKQVSVWSGFRGCGKSTLLNELILNAAQKGFKSALYTGELPEDMEKQWLYLQASGKQHNKKYGTSDYYYVPDAISSRIDSWIDKYLWTFNNKYGDNFVQISDQVRRLKDEEDIDIVLLDNLMVLNFRELDQDKFERQGTLLQRLNDLAKELDIHIHLVAHPNKSSGFIRIDNISGSGDISNKADNVFLMSRVNTDFINNAKNVMNKFTYQQILDSHCTNVIEIGKFRNKGSLVGHYIQLWFELESSRLKNDIAENIIYNWEDATQLSLNYGDTPLVQQMAQQQQSNGLPFGGSTDEQAPF